MHNARRPVAVLVLAVLAGCGREVETDYGALPATMETGLAAAEPAAEMRLAGLDPATPSELPPDPEAMTLTTVLYSERDAEVGARKDGVVQSFRVELGDRVEEGQLLAVLDDAEENAVVESSRAALDLARLEHDRAVELRERDLISVAEFERSVYRLRAAEAALDEATVQLEHTRVRAPFAGSISRRFLRVGQSVEEGTPLYRVTALRPLRARIQVPELASRGLAAGQTLHLRSAGGEEVRGSVLRVAPTVDPGSGTVEVLVNVEEPGQLRPGSAATVELAAGPGPPP